MLRQAFISHTGQDNDHGINSANFATHLAERLQRDGIGRFIDHKSLKIGSDWSNEIIDHAQRSQVMVVVLSRSYFVRYWCMRELDLALRAIEAGAAITIIPVYYGIDNLDGLRDQKVRSECRQQWKAFAGRDGVDADRWMHNLELLRHHQAARLQRVTKSSEIEFEEAVAKRVFQVIPQGLLEGETVGLEDHSATVKSLLSSEAVVAIVGAGGMGKSTLASHIYNGLLADFQGAAASVEIGEDGDTNKALDTLLKGLGANNIAADKRAKLQQLRDALVQKGRVLLLLDNLWTAQDLTDLLPCVPHGSKVMFTTRHAGVLTSTAASEAQRFDMPELSPDAALKLFRYHTRMFTPPADLQGVECEIVKACGGMPLALEVAGSFLRGKQVQQQWQAVLAQLTTGPSSVDDGGRLGNVVNLSVENLDSTANAMFLDAVTVMYGRSVQHALCAWQTMYSTQGALAASSILEQLQQRSLVKTDDKGKLWVHDIIKAVAGRKAGDGNRIWCANQTLKLKDKLREALLHTKEQLGALHRSRSAGLEVLLLDGTRGDTAPELDDILQNALHSSLVWLSGSHQMSRAPMANYAQLELLAVVDLSGCSEIISLPEPFGHLPALRILNLSGCAQLSSLPGSFGNLTALTLLDLGSCHELSSLPASFGNLTALTFLDLGQCSALSRLPAAFGSLIALTSLRLQYCKGLTSLPPLFGNLTALTSADLSGAWDTPMALSSLPESFGNLIALTSLNMQHCSALSSLPDSFGNLTALTSLDLMCKSLTSLPKSFGNLTALTSLNLHYCESLVSLPESFGNLTALTELNLCGCESLVSLPESFGNLTALTQVDLSCWYRLASLPESFGNLTALTSLDLSDCGMLSSLPESFGDLTALTSLDLRDCFSLSTLPESFGNLTALTQVDLSCCFSLASLPESFGNLTALTSLSMRACERLTGLPESFDNLTALTSLTLSCCSALRSLPPLFGNLTALTSLDLEGCESLDSLPESFGDLTALTSLDLRLCKSLVSLPESFGNLTALTSLDLSLSWCKSLGSLPESFGNLTALTSLDLSGSDDLDSDLSSSDDSDSDLSGSDDYDSDLSGSDHLDSGSDDFSMSLSSLPESFGNLTALTSLKLRHCESLASMPESFGNLTALTSLDLERCESLMQLPESFGNLTALTSLDVTGCPAMLPGKVRSSQTLHIEGR